MGQELKKQRQPAALGVLRSSDNKEILLVKRRDVPVWVLPGGGIDQGETAEAAVVREFWEETGLRVSINKKIAEYTPLNSLASPAHLFECKKIDGTERITCETSAIAYFPLEHLPASLFIVHRDWIEDAQSGDPEVLKKVIWRVTYKELAKYFLMHPLLLIRYCITRLTNRG